MGESKNRFPKTSSFKFYQPTPNLALVAEGGGQRGIFTAGVLDSWLNQGFNPFGLMIGTSAGAQNLSSYLTSQQGFAQQSILKLTKQDQFFKLGRALAGKSSIDLDWYFDRVKDSTLSLDVEAGVDRLKRQTLLISATDTATRRARYFIPNASNWLTLLKASSALPILYRDGVTVDNRRYVDGGLAAPVPVEEAYRRGAKVIVVIRTLPEGADVESVWAHKMKSWLCSERRCPAIIDLITHHELAYRRSLNFIENPPEGVKVLQITPQKPLRSRLVNSAYEDLEEDYKAGYSAGLKFIYEHDLKGWCLKDAVFTTNAA